MFDYAYALQKISFKDFNASTAFDWIYLVRFSVYTVLPLFLPFFLVWIFCFGVSLYTV